MISEFLDQPIGASKYFKWKEALYLKQWDVHAFPKSDSVYLNIIEVSNRLTLIREFLQKPLLVTSWYRPEKYNTFIRGAFNSSHKDGLAVDVVCPAMGAEEVRMTLLDKLDEFNIRMENLPNSTWVHIDIRVTEGMTISQRFFKP